MNDKLKSTILSLIDVSPPVIRESLRHVLTVAPVQGEVVIVPDRMHLFALYSNVPIADRMGGLGVYGDPKDDWIGACLEASIGSSKWWGYQCVVRDRYCAYHLAASFSSADRDSFDGTPLHWIVAHMALYTVPHLRQAMFALGGQRVNIRKERPKFRPAFIIPSRITGLVARIFKDMPDGLSLREEKRNYLAVLVMLKPTGGRWKTVYVSDDRRIKAMNQQESVWIVRRERSICAIRQVKQGREIRVVSYVPPHLVGVGTFTVSDNCFSLRDENAMVACDNLGQIVENWDASWDTINISALYLPLRNAPALSPMDSHRCGG